MKTLILNFMMGFLYLSFMLCSQTGVAQPNERPLLGIGTFYNFQTTGLGVDLRASIPLNDDVALTPHFSYFPAGNKIHEYYFGTDINYHLRTYTQLRPYLFAGLYYDRWINSQNFMNKKAKKHNLVVETGIGAILDLGCFNPFIEYRYDIKWKEGALGIGVYISGYECFTRKRKGRCSTF